MILIVIVVVIVLVVVIVIMIVIVSDSVNVIVSRQSNFVALATRHVARVCNVFLINAAQVPRVRLSDDGIRAVYRHVPAPGSPGWELRRTEDVASAFEEGYAQSRGRWHSRRNPP
jgi:hypothetical protein